MKIYAQELLDKHKEDWGEFEPAGIDAPELKELFTESDKYHDDLTQSEASELLQEQQEGIVGQIRWAVDFLKEGNKEEALKDLNRVIEKSEAFITTLLGNKNLGIPPLKVSDEKLRDVFIKYLRDNMAYLSNTLIPMIGDEKQIHEVIRLLERLMPNYFYSTIGPLVARRIYARKVLADDTLNVDKSEGWSEFEPQFKELLPEQVKAPVDPVLPAQQREIVDLVGQAADDLAAGKLDSANINLRKIKSLTYNFLNAVQKTKVRNQNEKKELIENMLAGVDQIDRLMGEIEAARKDSSIDQDALWQRLLKTTALFMGNQVRDIVGRVYARNFSPTRIRP